MNALGTAAFDLGAIAVGTLATATIAAFLGFVLALLDRLLNNYGILGIDINDGKKRLSIKGGFPLLATLAGEGIFVPSACGGKGSCGACKCRVLTDVGPILPTETPYLTPGEIASQYRLACQVKVKKNLQIAIPDELFYVKKYQAKLDRIKDLTYDIKELYFSLEGQKIEFAPGKYVQLVVPPYDKVPESVQRAYSMSSSPGDDGHVEILVRFVPGGIATTWVHRHLKAGDTVELVGPFGEFYVRDTAATMLCVAGGSGMAPFRSILRHMADSGAWGDRDIWYFFGARTTKDMFYLDELEALSKRLPRFHFVSALSEPKPDEGWTGDTGLITDVLDRYIKERIAKDRPFEGYLCGSPGMIAACTKVMTKNGVPEDRIYYDKFS
jgi:Na+-transporting NADH:ubiquinone oxidoreductase subunit F